MLTKEPVQESSNYIDVNDISVFSAILASEGDEDLAKEIAPEVEAEEGEVEVKPEADFADEDDADLDGGVSLNESDEEEDLVEEDEVKEDEVEVESGEYELDFETEVTLPNGEVMSIKELRDGYLAGTEVTSLKEEAEELRTKYDEQYSTLKDKLELSILECDRVIEDYSDYDWEEVAKESPEEYAENAQFLKRYKARRNELEKAYKTEKKSQEERVAAETQESAVACLQTLQKDIPEWSNDLYQQLMEHAVNEFGIAQDLVLNLTDPGAFKLLHNSYKATTGRKSAAVKIKKAAQSPKKVVKTKKAKIKKSKPVSADPRMNAFNNLVD